MRHSVRMACGIASVVLAGALVACGDGGTPGPASSTATAASTGPASTPPAGSVSARPTSPANTPATRTTVKPPASPPKPAPGTAFDGENMSAADAKELQAAVDEGHQPWRIDVTMVAEVFVLSRFGWDKVDCRLADPHTAEVTNRVDGRIVSLQLRQPATEGESGIWTVVGGVWIK